MSRIRFSNGAVLLPAGVADEVTLAHERGIILSLGADEADEMVDLGGGWLLPGFVDTQVNGGGGVLFNDAPSVETITAIGRAHAAFGTTSFMVTLISDAPAAVAAALEAADAAVEAGVPGMIGIHVEGPAINPARRGIHDAAKIRPLEGALLDLLLQPRRARVMVTLAPELCSAADIAALRAAGVVVSAGHSDASYEQTRAALDAGVTGFTHLYNAMSPLRHRAPGMVGAALEDSSSYCGLIVDGAHLHPAAVRIALAIKPHDRIMLVTDAMPVVGSGGDGFELGGEWISLRDGRCVNSAGTLAGSALDMARALRNLVAQTGIDVPAAARMASSVPAAFLGLADRIGSLAPGLRADWVWLDAELNPKATWIGGVRVAATDRAS